MHISSVKLRPLTFSHKFNKCSGNALFEMVTSQSDDQLCLY